MLNGVDPIIIFNFKKKISADVPLGKFPMTEAEAMADQASKPLIDLPFIPIYLSEKLTGVYIDTEHKNIDIDTNIETLTSGNAPITQQRGIQSTVKIEMFAKRDSIGISLFAALSDLIFPKVTSKEYSITYLHGAVTVFGGLLHSFSIQQNSNNELYNISLELIKPAPVKGLVPIVPKLTGAIPL